MKTLTDAQRAAIDSLRKTLDNNQEPTWEISIFRNMERMLGIMEGDRITSGSPDDVNPTVAQSSDGRYHVIFERGGSLYSMISGAENIPEIEWGEPQSMFSGQNPDVDFDGSFATIGTFTTSNLLLVYEDPPNTMKFRRRSEAGSTWSSPVTIGAGHNPTICRGWADPPEVGSADMGYIVAYTQGGALYYRYSEDEGASWSAEILLDMPPGGTKTNVQVIRLADYTHGFIYDYDTGLTSEVWFLKSTRKYVNIASPDEVLTIRAGTYYQGFFTRLDIFASTDPEGGEGSEEIMLTPGAGEYRHDFFPFIAHTFEETVEIGAGGYQNIFFSGVNP